MTETKYKKIIISLLVFNLLISFGIIGYLCFKNNKVENKYTLYIGLNDKDTYVQEITKEEAYDIVNNICLKYTKGYTLSEAQGGWTDETDTLTQENTLVYTFYGISKDTLMNIMDEVLLNLNQSSILVEEGKVYYTYYYGS